MYRDLKKLYWWPGQKKDTVYFVTKCQNFRQVKYANQSPAWFFQRMTIPQCKWERIVMDFVVGFPKTLGKLDFI